MVVSSVKGKKPDTMDIGCIKFRTGKANLGGSDWEKRAWGAVEMLCLDQGNVIQVCSRVKIHKAIHQRLVHFAICNLQNFTKKLSTLP